MNQNCQSHWSRWCCHRYDRSNRVRTDVDGLAELPSQLEEPQQAQQSRREWLRALHAARIKTQRIGELERSKQRRAHARAGCCP
eukprot:CAMPEP_0174242104 /NCGR_PEP_ID=MMETSP0417-20130205/26417_1 /TAXON_ID=242541 /ORGANISM="Mayorella sp, Strain BSH-02190019" /LENGTH=83 /DNA_ID=CAMNT_0015321459 /DNA_START=130 /DNA_END=377 /DNA_ORIENTATION=+